MIIIVKIRYTYLLVHRRSKMNLLSFIRRNIRESQLSRFRKFWRRIDNLIFYEFIPSFPQMIKKYTSTSRIEICVKFDNVIGKIISIFKSLEFVVIKFRR